jgi:hypothetical protein
MIKSTRVRWAGNLTRIGEGRGAYKVLVEKPEERRRSRCTQGDKIKRIVAWAGSVWLRIGTSGGLL